VLTALSARLSAICTPREKQISASDVLLFGLEVPSPGRFSLGHSPSTTLPLLFQPSVTNSGFEPIFYIGLRWEWPSSKAASSSWSMARLIRFVSFPYQSSRRYLI
jgi:hypothetical protein